VDRFRVVIKGREHLRRAVFRTWPLRKDTVAICWIAGDCDVLDPGFLPELVEWLAEHRPFEEWKHCLELVMRKL
jgi:hypothetical protein